MASLFLSFYFLYYIFFIILPAPTSLSWLFSIRTSLLLDQFWLRAPSDTTAWCPPWLLALMIPFAWSPPAPFHQGVGTTRKYSNYQIKTPWQCLAPPHWQQGQWRRRRQRRRQWVRSVRNNGIWGGFIVEGYGFVGSVISSVVVNIFILVFLLFCFF